MIIVLPIRTKSELNTHEHWGTKANRAKRQKNYVTTELNVKGAKFIRPIMTSVSVKLTRIAPRRLDEDNLLASFKAIRDAVASWLIPGMAPGFADSSPLMTFIYFQNRGSPKEYAVKIEII